MGEVTADPIRVCPFCKAIYLEDDQMQADVDRCPHCGADISPADPAGPIDEMGAWV